MCVTAGVVSRIETGVYTNAGVSGSELLLMQIDAAINSGNSGGPVFDLTGRCVSWENSFRIMIIRSVED